MKRIFTILLILVSFTSKAQVGGTSFSGGANYVFLPACDEVSPGVFQAVLRLFNLGSGQTLKFVNVDMTNHVAVNIMDENIECTLPIRGTFSTNKNKACYADNDDTLGGYVITIYRDSIKVTTIIEDLNGNPVLGATEVSPEFCIGPIEVLLTNNVDPFERLRVANPITLFDATFLYDKQPQLFDELTTGTGISTENPDEGVVDMSVTTNGSRVVRQSYRYITYQPGKSFFVTLTGSFVGTSNTNILSRIGLFDNHADKTVDDGGNGYFFEYSNDSLFAVERSYVTGSQVDIRIPAHLWNMTNPGIDPTKLNIIIIEAQWSGTGRVRLGFNIDGKNVWVHSFNHSNTLVSTFTSRMSLPVRYEITQVLGGSGGTMKMASASVVSEGGYFNTGRIRTTNASKDLPNENETAILVIRVQDDYNRLSNELKSVSAVFSGKCILLVRVYIDPSITGGSYSDITNSGNEQNTTMTGFSGGTEIYSVYISEKQRGQLFDIPNERLRTGADIEGNPQEILITVKCIELDDDDDDDDDDDNGQTAYVTLNWQEIY